MILFSWYRLCWSSWPRHSEKKKATHFSTLIKSPILSIPFHRCSNTKWLPLHLMERQLQRSLRDIYSLIQGKLLQHKGSTWSWTVNLLVQVHKVPQQQIAHGIPSWALGANLAHGNSWHCSPSFVARCCHCLTKSICSIYIPLFN